MSEPREGAHHTRTIEGQAFDVWPLIWQDGGKSWEVRDVATDTLLTMDESLDDEPSDQEIIDLTDTLPHGLSPDCTDPDSDLCDAHSTTPITWIGDLK